MPSASESGSQRALPHRRRIHDRTAMTRPKALRALRSCSAFFLMWVAFACSSSSGSSGSNGNQGPPGPQGPPGTSVAPSLVGVTPRVLLLDREVDVVIAGNATTFTGMEMPDFGAGVGVFNVTLISPTALGAHLKVDKAAAVGPRDLHVGSLTAAQAFTVAPPIAVSVLAGTPAQGGL